MGNGRNASIDNDDHNNHHGRAHYYVCTDDNIVVYDNGRIDNYNHFRGSVNVDNVRASDNKYDHHDPGTNSHDDFIVQFDYVVHDDGCAHDINDHNDCPHDSCHFTSDDDNNND